jgi:hypothetical protein
MECHSIGSRSVHCSASLPIISILWKLASFDVPGCISSALFHCRIETSHRSHRAHQIHILSAIMGSLRSLEVHGLEKSFFGFLNDPDISGYGCHLDVAMLS